MKRLLLVSTTALSLFAVTAGVRADDGHHGWAHHGGHHYLHHDGHHLDGGLYLHLGLYGPYVAGPYLYVPSIEPYYHYSPGAYVYHYGYAHYPYSAYRYQSRVLYYRYAPRRRVYRYYYSPSTWYMTPYGGYYRYYRVSPRSRLRVHTPGASIHVGF